MRLVQRALQECAVCAHKCAAALRDRGRMSDLVSASTVVVQNGADDKATAVAADARRSDVTASKPARPPYGFEILDGLPPLTEEQKDALASTAQRLATRGKGILAADESTPTVSRVECSQQLRFGFSFVILAYLKHCDTAVVWSEVQV